MTWVLYMTDYDGELISVAPGENLSDAAGASARSRHCRSGDCSSSSMSAAIMAPTWRGMGTSNTRGSVPATPSSAYALTHLPQAHSSWTLHEERPIFSIVP
jgi:hypothetical protein